MFQWFSIHRLLQDANRTNKVKSKKPTSLRVNYEVRGICIEKHACSKRFSIHRLLQAATRTDKVKSKKPTSLRVNLRGTRKLVSRSSSVPTVLDTTSLAGRHSN